MEVARDLASSYPDGAWLVELAPLSQPELVPQAVGNVLEVREQPDRPLVDTLVGHLRQKDLLLVLDNCEHLIEACAQLREFASSLLPASQGLGHQSRSIGGGRRDRMAGLFFVRARH